MRKSLLSALMCALLITLAAGNANAGNGITTRTIGTEQIVGLRENAMFDGRWSCYTTLSYTNFNNPTDNGAVWGGDLGFAFVSDRPYVRPVNAHFMGGWHKTWDHFRVYGAATLGVGRVAVATKSHNEMFSLETYQRQFTLTLGACVGVMYQGPVIGIGLFGSWDYNLFQMPEMPNDLLVDQQVAYTNPLTIGVMVTYALQNGTTRQDGDRSWRGGAGYIFGLGENSIDRTYARLGKTVKHSGKWSGEYGMQFEYNYSKSYSAAKLTYEETFLPWGSRSRIRFVAGAAAGFCNVLVSSDSYAHREQEGGEGEIKNVTYNMQPGFCFGGMLGVDVRLFGRLHLDAQVTFDHCRTEKPKTQGFDESVETAAPMNLWGASVGLRYTL